MLGGGNCIDLDNYDGAIPLATVEALRADGCLYAIVGCQDSAIGALQVATLTAGGIEVIGLYAYLYWGGDVLAEVAKAIEIARAAEIGRVYLDCERDGELPDQTPASRVAQLRDALAAVQAAGLEAGIYTNEPFWREAMGDTTGFSALALWHSAYWYDLHHVGTVSYGGWTDVAVHQYTASGNRCYAADGTLGTVPALGGINAGYNIAYPGGLTMAFTEAQEARIREIVSDTVAAEFRALLDAAFTGGFTEPDGTPLPVPDGVAKYLATERSGEIVEHTHTPGGVVRDRV